MTLTQNPELSIVIPVYNEEAVLPLLFERLMKSLFALNKTFEIIMTNDGSKDNSYNLLKSFHQAYPEYVRIINFQGNFGQHEAIMAAFERVRGNTIITLDADLQNPPEEIYKVVQKYNEGFDYVGSYRADRQDNFFRTYASRLVNWFRDRITTIRMKDQGCMLRAYSKSIIQQIIQSRGSTTFIPALAYYYAQNPAEVEVQHDARTFGESKYSLYLLARVTFDLITSFSIVPLQLFTLFGILISVISGVFSIYMMGRRLFYGPELEGAFTLFTIVFFLLSLIILGLGIVGEYVGRIFQAVNHRPRYVIHEILENN